MKPRRILHVDSGRTWRGGQRQALLLALGLRDRGHEPFLIGSPGSPLVEKAQAAGLAVATVPMAGDWDIRAARRIRSRMRAWRVDAVHAHDAKAHALAMLALVGLPGVPLFVTRRVPFAPRSVRIKYGTRVSRFIAVSEAVRSAMIAAGVDAARISTVHSGIPSRTAPVNPRDWRGELGWPDDAVICGIVGAMTREKGIDLVPSIAAALPPSVLARVRLVLLGDLSADIPRAAGLTVHAAGFQEDIDSAVAGLDMLWHPSRAEGLGTSVIDAMSLGIPPIAFRVGGLPEVIDHGVSGVIAGPGDVEAFATGVSRLVEDRIWRELLAAGARAKSATFSAANMTKETEAVYDDVLPG